MKNTSKFEAMLNNASAKVQAEKDLKETILRNRINVLAEFAMPIYEFVAYINKKYEKHPYNDGFGTGHRYIRMTDIFEFSTYRMPYGIGAEFSIEEAKKHAEVDLVSHILNDRIYLNIDDDLNILASIGYEDKTKYFKTAEALIEEVCYMIEKNIHKFTCTK